MTLTRIRPFEDRDYPGIVAVGNAVYIDYPWSVKEARHEDSRFAGEKYLFRRFVAELPHPDLQRHGLGGRLYDHVMRDLAPHDPLVLWTNVRETFPESVRFAERRGFTEARRVWESRLDVGRFDPTPFEAKAATLNAPMLHINTAMGFVRQPAWITYEKRLEASEGGAV